MILNDYKIDYPPFTLPNREPVRITADQDGEKLTSLNVFYGYTHKGIEKILTATPYKDVYFYMEHLNNFDRASVLYNYLHLYETAAGITVAEETEILRLVILETARIRCHLKSLNEIGRLLDIGEMIKITAAMLKETYGIMDTGDEPAMTVGDINAKFKDDDFAPHLTSFLKTVFRKAIKGLGNIFKNNSLLKKRLEGMGILSAEDARNYGITGVNLRACGVKYDTRTQNPYGAYSLLPPFVPTGEGGDAYTRYRLRLEEIFASYLLINSAAEKIKPATTKTVPASDGNAIPPPGFYDAVTETPYGEMRIYLRSSDKHTPERIRISSPSLNALTAFKKAAAAHFVSDIPIILNSFNIAFSEIDK